MTSLSAPSTQHKCSLKVWKWIRWSDGTSACLHVLLWLAGPNIQVPGSEENAGEAEGSQSRRLVCAQGQPPSRRPARPPGLTLCKLGQFDRLVHLCSPTTCSGAWHAEALNGSVLNKNRHRKCKAGPVQP